MKRPKELWNASWMLVEWKKNLENPKNQKGLTSTRLGNVYNKYVRLFVRQCVHTLVCPSVRMYTCLSVSAYVRLSVMFFLASVEANN